MVTHFCNSFAASGSILYRYRAADAFALKVHRASVMLVFTFIGLVLPILVVDADGKKKREDRDDRICYRC